jgi:hypothetical protein
MLMLCPICAGEYEVDASVCPTCEFKLVPSALKEERVESHAAAEERQPQFVELCRPLMYPIAVLIRQTLEQNGVAVVMHGEHSLSVQPHLVFGGQLRVLVPSNQLDFAQELYRAYFEGNEEIDYIAQE